MGTSRGGRMVGVGVGRHRDRGFRRTPTANKANCHSSREGAGLQPSHSSSEDQLGSSNNPASGASVYCS